MLTKPSIFLKVALLRFWKDGYFKLLLQFHDEQKGQEIIVPLDCYLSAVNANSE